MPHNMDNYTIYIIERYSETIGRWFNFDEVEYRTMSEAIDHAKTAQASDDGRFRIHTIGYYDLPSEG